MKYNIIDNNNEIIFIIENELDKDSSIELLSEFDYIINDLDKNLVIDMEKTDYIDSSGLGLMMYTMKRLAEKDKSFTIQGLQGQPKNFFNQYKINDIWH